jgi:hypothetical protein
VSGPENRRMVGATCTGCNLPGTSRRPVSQRDLGSADKWHADCYRAAQRARRAR